jgi:PAS domain S-box-containing protein
LQLLSRPAGSTTSRDALPAVLAVLEQLGHGVWVVSGSGQTEYLNAVALGFLGSGQAPNGAADGGVLHIAHVAGTDDIYNPADLPLARALAGESARVDDVEMWRDTDHVVLEVVGQPLADSHGDAAGALIVMVDITSRVRLPQTQRELKVAQGRFQVAQEKAPMGMAMVGLDHRFTDVNDFLCRLTGRSREELIGLRPADLLDPEDAQHHRALNDALVAEDGNDYTELVEIVRSPGDVVSVELTVGMIRGDDGRAMHQMILAQDITERVDTERVVADLNVALSERGGDLERLNRDLGRLNRDLVRSNRDLEEFAYIASHDLSEPLRSVTGYVQLLAKRYRGQLDPEADEFISFAVDGVNRMQTLIRDLLTYARADVRSEAVSVDCAELLTEIVASIGETRADAEFEIGPMPVVVCAPAQLRQVFDNLLSNAVKFVAADRVPHVTVTAREVGATWQFTVADNGIGIDERHRERIFGMFQRLHARTDYPGTGIGLAICRRVVERLGGTISVTSSVGVGTEFIVTIPAAPGDST